MYQQLNKRAQRGAVDTSHLSLRSPLNLKLNRNRSVGRSSKLVCANKAKQPNTHVAPRFARLLSHTRIGLLGFVR
jgi:hypothetical protein